MGSVETFELHSDGAVYYVASNGSRVRISNEGPCEAMATLAARAWVVEQTIEAMATKETK
jgi:hypothetical protein